jgi:hypothetical protein
MPETTSTNVASKMANHILSNGNYGSLGGAKFWNDITALERGKGGYVEGSHQNLLIKEKTGLYLASVEYRVHVAREKIILLHHYYDLLEDVKISQSRDVLTLSFSQTTDDIKSWKQWDYIVVDASWDPTKTPNPSQTNAEGNAPMYLQIMQVSTREAKQEDGSNLVVMDIVVESCNSWEIFKDVDLKMRQVKIKEFKSDHPLDRRAVVPEGTVSYTYDVMDYNYDNNEISEDEIAIYEKGSSGFYCYECFFNLDLDFEFDFSYSGTKVKRIIFKMGPSAAAGAGALLKGVITLDYSITVIDVSFSGPSFSTFGGALEVSIPFDFTIELAGEVTISLVTITGPAVSFSAESGIEVSYYKGDGWDVSTYQSFSKSITGISLGGASKLHSKHLVF